VKVRRGQVNALGDQGAGEGKRMKNKKKKKGSGRGRGGKRDRSESGEEAREGIGHFRKYGKAPRKEAS